MYEFNNENNLFVLTCLKWSISCTRCKVFCLFLTSDTQKVFLLNCQPYQLFNGFGRTKLKVSEKFIRKSTFKVEKHWSGTKIDKIYRNSWCVEYIREPVVPSVKIIDRRRISSFNENRMFHTKYIEVIVKHKLQLIYNTDMHLRINLKISPNFFSLSFLPYFD